MDESVEWDEGYPTEESLKALRMNRVDYHDAAPILQRELAACADNCCASYGEEIAKDFLGKPVTRCSFSTGGWSGAEDLIGVLLGHFWIKHLQTAWRVGGHYQFEIPTPLRAGGADGGGDE